MVVFERVLSLYLLVSLCPYIPNDGIYTIGDIFSDVSLARMLACHIPAFEALTAITKSALSVVHPN